MVQRAKTVHPLYNPLQVFAGSKTPVGLYARQKWLDEKDTDRWHRDFEETVRQLRTGQLHDGSWSHSEIETIHRLFGLHLTVREADDSVRQALEWLFRTDTVSNFLSLPHGAPDEMYGQGTNKLDKTLFKNLPFVRGCFGHLVVCAVLFFHNCFGLSGGEFVGELYEIIGKEIESKGGRWCSIECTTNALRAFVTNDQYSRGKTTAMMVNYLGRRQLASGRWRGSTSFYLTLNALAHLDGEDARTQCTAAISEALRLQNKDGSWGKSEKEWNTFLVVHALRRLKVW